MHELSIVINILDIVEEAAIEHQAKIVHEIEMEVGMLAGVEFDALEFAFENAPKAEAFKNVKFRVHKVQPVSRCMDCFNEFETEEYSTPCPKCLSTRTELVKGNELRVMAFKID